VTAAVAAAPEKFVVSDVKWTGGTEQMLDAVEQHLKVLEQVSASSEECLEPTLVATSN